MGSRATTLFIKTSFEAKKANRAIKIFSLSLKYGTVARVTFTFSL